MVPSIIHFRSKIAQDCMIQSIITLEDFPDELFYEIFEYISAEDLYDGFYDLNIRLYLVRSVYYTYLKRKVFVK